MEFDQYKMWYGFQFLDSKQFKDAFQGYFALEIRK